MRLIFYKSSARCLHLFRMANWCILICSLRTSCANFISYPDTPTQILLWDPIWQLPYRVVCSCTSLCEGELRNITKQLLECCEGFVTRPKDPWKRRRHHHSRLSILTTEGCPLSKHSIVKFAIGNAMWVVVWKIWGKKLKKKEKKRRHRECFQLSQAYIFFSRLT